MMQVAEGSTKFDHVFKILLIGDSGVGKSRYISSSSKAFIVITDYSMLLIVCCHNMPMVFSIFKHRALLVGNDCKVMHVI